MKNFFKKTFEYIKCNTNKLTVFVFTCFLISIIFNLSFSSQVRTLNLNMQAEREISNIEIQGLKIQLEEINSDNQRLKSMLQTSSRGSYFDDTLVYVNPTGKVYHKKYCQYVGADTYSKFLTDAEKDGYKKCSKCY